MIPPPQYRLQVSPQVQSAFPSYRAEENSIEYILEEDGLRLPNAFRSLYDFVKYSDMRTIRLDYAQTKKKKIFSCYINENITIETELLSQSIFSSKTNDLEYNAFVLKLHEKLLNLPSETRTFHTGLTAENYYILLGFLTILWFGAIGFGVMMLQGEKFEPLSLLFYGLLLFITVSSVVNNQPTTYAPTHIPDRFLS